MHMLALLAFAGAALASPMPQGVTSAIAPASSAPAGCSSSYSGSFEITIVNVTTSAKRDLVERQASGVLTLTLTDSILKDQDSRTGYIAANFQFQFDNPPQNGAIYTSGFSVCSNGSLALGGSAIWWSCLSGSFYNLYDRNWAAQCFPVYIDVLPGASSDAVTQASDAQPGATTAVTEASEGQPEATTVVTQISDGQPQATTAVPVSQISDGQPQATTAVPVSQISDGQPQATTAVPVSQISDGQPQATTAVPVSQISDGQPQATTGAPVTQISDGQPQATTGAPVSEISDGQPQATTGAPVSEISDGQPQATTGVPVSEISDGQPQATTGAPVTQISDGQPQAPTTSATPVTEASEGQPEAPTSTSVLATASSVAPATFTGAAVPQHRVSGGLVAFIAGVVALL